MFGPLKEKQLSEAVHTQNHFFPIIGCFLVSLALLYLGGQFSGSQKRKPTDEPDTFSPIIKKSGAVPPPVRPEQSLFEELKAIRNKFDILQIVGYTLVLIIFGTFLLLFLVRNNYVRLIRYWFSVAYFLVLFFFNYMLLKTLLKDRTPFAIDLITLAFLLWNLSVTGVNCVLFDGPLICYKLTILHVSIIFACFLFAFAGSVFCWVFILILTVWDFVAVLSPSGPLKQLAQVDESQAARVLNAIVYSADNQQTSKEVTSKELTSKELQSEIRKMKKYLQSQKQRGVDEETAIRSLMMSSILYESNDCSIGLGDFVFFTLQIILIAEISRNPFFVFGSILLILVGLFITICILTTTHSPLPALPISIVLCQVGFAVMYQFVGEKIDAINSRMVFI